MSIYATLWSLKFPRYGECHHGCEWVTVLAQGVPAHVGHEKGGDPFADFLPPPVAEFTTAREGEEIEMRAVVFVTDGTKKGSQRSGQEYVGPLLVLSGAEYRTITFAALYARLCTALRGARPRVALEIGQPDGSVKVCFEDGSSLLLSAPSSISS